MYDWIVTSSEWIHRYTHTHTWMAIYTKKTSSALAGWLSEWSAGLQTKGLPVQFPVSAPDQVPSWGRARGNRSVTHQCFCASLSPSLPLSLKINKILKKKKRIRVLHSCSSSATNSLCDPWLSLLNSSSMYSSTEDYSFPTSQDCCKAIWKNTLKSIRMLYECSSLIYFLCTC